MKRAEWRLNTEWTQLGNSARGEIAAAAEIILLRIEMQMEEILLEAAWNQLAAFLIIVLKPHVRNILGINLIVQY